MPVIQVSNDYSNIDFAPLSGSTYTNNAGDKTQLELVVAEKIRLTSVNNPFSFDPLLYVLTSPTLSWLEEGFRVGDTVLITRYDKNGVVLYNLYTNISSLTDTEMNCTLWLPGLFYNIADQDIMEVVAVYNNGTAIVPRPREDLLLELNHSLNDQQGTNASLIDGELSRILFTNVGTNLAIGSTVSGTFVGNQSGQFLYSGTIKKEGLDADLFMKYTITLVFVNSGIYDKSWFDSGNCLKFFIRGLWSSKVGETFKRSEFVLDEQANTGWFDESHNSSIPATGSIITPITELKYNVPNTFTYVIDTNGISLTDLAIGGAYISIDDTYYKNRLDSQRNITYLLKTSLIQLGQTYTSENGVGSSSGANWEFTFDSQQLISGNYHLTFTWEGNSDFNTFMDSRVDGDKLFRFWIRIGNVNHLLFDGQLTKELPVGGPLTMNTNYGFLDHSENVTEKIGSQTTQYSADTEDDIGYYGTFNLDINKQTYNGIALRVEAHNTVSNDTFTLQQTNFSFAGVTYQTSSGKYLLNEVATINTDLQTTSLKRDATIVLTGNGSATQYEVAVYYPFLLNWRYWIPLLGVSTDFAPNENQNWEQYDNLGNWEIRMLIELNDNNLAFIHSDTIVDNAYDYNANVNSSIELQKQSDNSVVGIIPTGELLFIESTHILTTGSWDIQKIWGMITVEPKESSPRSISSTIIPWDNNLTNPLTPISGLLCQMTLVSADTIKLKCKFDPSKIDVSNGVKITAKIKQGLNNILVLNKITTSNVDKETTSNDLKIIA